MELAPGIHLIPGTIGNRLLNLALLRGDSRTVLLDTGTAHDPEHLIFPFLAQLGLAPTDIDIVINTHSDADHVGGNAALKRANPNVSITCGTADASWIQDPPRMIRERYGAYGAKHGIAPNEPTNQWYANALGDAQQIDWTWSGGEALRLAPDWVIEILSTPGHSRGHLTIFDPRSRTAWMGDAVQGGIGRDGQGNFTVPAYMSVDDTLHTVQLLRNLNPAILAGCHWNVMRGQEIQDFLDATENYVRNLDAAICRELEARPEGAVMSELVQSIGAAWCGENPPSDLELVFTFGANIDSLVERGVVREDLSVNPARYHTK